MSEIIIRNEVPFCELDSHAGDGDFGMSVAKGFKELKRQWHEVVAQGKEYRCIFRSLLYGYHGTLWRCFWPCLGICFQNSR